MPNVLEQLLGGNNQGVDTQKILQQLFGMGQFQGGLQGQQVQQTQQPSQETPGQALIKDIGADASEKVLRKGADKEAKERVAKEGIAPLAEDLAQRRAFTEATEGIRIGQNQGQQQGQMKFVPNPNPFGFEGPNKEGTEYRDTGFMIKLLNLVYGGGIKGGAQGAKAMQQMQGGQTKGVYGFDPVGGNVEKVGEIPAGAELRNLLSSFGIDTGIGGINETGIPEGMEITGYDVRGRPKIGKIKPTIKEKETERREAEMDVKLKELNTTLNDIYFPVADLLPTANGMGRWVNALRLKGKSLAPKDVEGTAAAALDNLNKRLRVTLVRAAGDVGNINIMEQLAAEQLLYKLNDTDKLREVKKATLQDLTRAINKRDKSAVRNVISKWMKTEEFKKMQPDLTNLDEEQPQKKKGFKVIGVR